MRTKQKFPSGSHSSQCPGSFGFVLSFLQHLALPYIKRSSSCVWALSCGCQPADGSLFNVLASCSCFVCYSCFCSCIRIPWFSPRVCLFLFLFPFPISPARLWLNCQMCLGAVSPFHCPRSWPCASAFPPSRIKNKASEKQGKWRKPRGRGSWKAIQTAEALYSIHRTNLHVSDGPIHVEPSEAFEVLWLPFDNLAHEWGVILNGRGVCEVLPSIR